MLWWIFSILCVAEFNNLHVQGQSLVLSLSLPTAVEGRRFQITCRAVGIGSLSGILTFQRGSSLVCRVNSETCSQFSNINGYNCSCVRGQTSTTVFFTNIASVRKEDGGTWRCQFGTITSQSVILAVHYAPVITSVRSSQLVPENTSPNIDCSTNITPGNPSSTTYRWTGPGYSKTGSVLDRNVTRTQGGQYTCTATNTARLSATATITINVQYPPMITSVPSSNNITENTSPNIDCSSNITPGNPSSTSYRWTGPGGYIKTGAVLDRTVTRTQGGQYTCTANNTAGLSDTATVTINVQYPPMITSVPSSKNITESTSLNLDCSSNITPGNPSSTSYRWTGPAGYINTGAVLDRTVTRTQGGQYTCTANNTAGLSDTATVTITVQTTSTVNGYEPNTAAIAGGIVAALLVIIIVASVFFLYKRGVFRTKDHPIATNSYSGMDFSNSEGQTYTSLRAHENTAVNVVDGQTDLYENLQEKAPETYENIQIPIYENTTHI